MSIESQTTNQQALERQITFPRPKLLPSREELCSYAPKAEWFSSVERAKSYYHGQDHLMRVLILQETLTRLLIESGKVLPENIDQIALRWAACLHDIGRTSDILSHDNIQKAITTANRILPPDLPEETREKIINLISQHDKPFDPRVPFATELAILKNADSLERIRLVTNRHSTPLPRTISKILPASIKTKVGLDPRYLYFDESRQMIPLAEELLRLSTQNEARRRADPIGVVLDAAESLGILSSSSENPTSQIADSVVGARERSLSGSVRSTLLLGRPDKAIQNDTKYQEMLPQLYKLYENAWRWHGTGRYQYEPPNYLEVRDVVISIIENNGLIPHEDPLDYTQEPMQSVSTSPARLYSSLYAQLHYELGKKLRNSLTNAYGWAFYMRQITQTALREDKQLLSRKFRKNAGLTAEGTAYFHKKYTTEHVGPKDMLRGGMSNIRGNYPILIGIKRDSFPEVEIAPVLRRHESRSKIPIPIDQFTHIEVPREYVRQVEETLEQRGIKGLPVIPLEFGEEYSRTLPIPWIFHGQKNE